MYKCFLRVKRSGIRSAKLSSVAKECGYKNYLYFPNKIPMLWQSNKQRLLLMNIVHVDALIYVDNSMNLSEFVLDVANLSGTNIADVHSSYHIITSFFMMNKNPNIVLPTSENGEREDYEGA
ncbi:MAG: hypothetical protein NZ879_08630, partial [Archaeoglobaceae archaeon]|nr:hypothetical protein [Archaeoglobaceae archaeon]MDW8119029.1 hypothetical protein [Archaeoglobaceae archaeon]